MEYMIGVDIGTTSTKAVLFDDKNVVVASANKSYALYRDLPDMAEEILMNFLRHWFPHYQRLYV